MIEINGSKIIFITTGGTIDKIYFDKKNKFQIGNSLIFQVLEDANTTIDYEIKSILKKDSLDINNADRCIIKKTIKNDRHRYFVVTHGTDTMILTAKKLREINDKVIILTGAMQPARFKSTDAVFNIACAITAVQLLPNGVYIVMNGKIFEPENVIKNSNKNRFEYI